MRPNAEYQRAQELIQFGVNDSEIGRRLEIPRGTIRDWRTRPRLDEPVNGCFRCRDLPFDAEAYAYLLGVYLGDGCISSHPRGVYRLRIFCDLKYRDIINEVATHMTVVRGIDKVGFTTRPGCVEVWSYWKHWPCLFPQHGPGRKHDRVIALSPWQQAIVDTHPSALIRGLIHSDGNRHVNTVSGRVTSGMKRYLYPRYMFTNRSEGILSIFTNALDQVGVHWTRSTAKDISVARKADVAYLDTFVGPKR